MGKIIDLTNQKFGYLTVIERDLQAQKDHFPERQIWWKCKCENCGNIKSFRGSVLRKGAKSCGCINPRRKNQQLTEEEKKKISEGVKSSDKFKQSIKKRGEESRIDLVGQKFTRLTVLEYADEQHQIYYNNKHKVTWKCQCDCGNICYVTTENLRRGDSPSCGCITKERLHNQLQDLTGKRFGYLTVLKWIGTINGNTKYLVKCDCGKEYEIYANNLTQNSTISCGCIKESHGENKIREILNQNNINFISQKSFKDFKYIDTNGTPKFDFYLPDYNILIEYDGEQHFKPIEKWGGEDKFILQKKHDQIKNNYALQNNYILIRIPYTHYNKICLEDLLINSIFKIER